MINNTGLRIVKRYKNMADAGLWHEKIARQVLYLLMQRPTRKRHDEHKTLNLLIRRSL